MKTFFCAVLVAAICLYVVQGHAEERVSSNRPGNTPAIPSGENYYAIFLAHQSSDNKIAMSHTFALFVRTQGHGPQRKIIETATINWLPVSGHISLVRPAEPGVNKTLGETLAWAKDQGLAISVLGPFEIDADFYRCAAAHVARLERGEWKYRCYNTNSRLTAKNCINAVADIFENEPRIDTGSSRGLEATQKVVEYYRPRFKSAELSGQEWSPLLAEFKLDELRIAGMESAVAGE